MTYHLRPLLIILSGVPSSGKSTLAKELAEALEVKYKCPVVVVSSDSFRRMIPAYRHRFEAEFEEFVRKATLDTIKEGLRHGLVVISDDTNYYSSIRRRLMRLAQRARADYAIIYVNTPLETALEWNKKRGEPVPPALIEEIFYKMDEPGSLYKWDKPLLTLDPSKEDLKAFVKTTAEKVQEKVRQEFKTKPTKKTEKGVLAGDLERETRRAMSELMRRFRDGDLAPQISEIRKEIIKEALRENLDASQAVTLFFERAQSLVSSRPSPAYKEGVIVHVGLFGHVDHGKTKLAACLSEKLSTASLDKHPEAQRRGMSIDIGFSAFSLGDYLVTLVDHPGHYSLIKHVMAGANIIDVGVLVVAADEGPMVQTLEHLHILNALDIRSLIVVINKMDLVDERRLQQVTEDVRAILMETKFADAPIVSVSAEKCEGIQELKETLLQNIIVPVRQWSGSLKAPISHAFNIAGIGTVATGTILRGSVSIKDVVEIQPTGKKSRIKFMQIFGDEVEKASAGDRVAFALSNIRSTDFSRGYYIVTPGTLAVRDIIDLDLSIDTRYRRSIQARSIVHVNVGMQTLTGRIYPYTEHGEIRVISKKVDPSTRTKAILKLDKATPVEVGDKILLMKLDLPPKEFRVIGVAEVKSLPEQPPKIHSARIRQGKIQSKASDDLYNITGLFSSREAVEHLIGGSIVTASQIKGTIRAPHGNAGDFRASFEEPPKDEERVFYYKLREMKIV